MLCVHKEGLFPVVYLFKLWIFEAGDNTINYFLMTCTSGTESWVRTPELMFNHASQVSLKMSTYGRQSAEQPSDYSMAANRPHLLLQPIGKLVSKWVDSASTFALVLEATSEVLEW